MQGVMQAAVGLVVGWHCTRQCKQLITGNELCFVLVAHCLFIVSVCIFKALLATAKEYGP